MTRFMVRVLLVGMVLLLGGNGDCQSQEKTDLPWKAGSATKSPETRPADDPPDKSGGVRGALWNTTISPYQMADIGPEVSGIIREIWFDEGDLVKEGQVIARLYNGRYVDLLKKAEARVTGLLAELKKVEEEARIQEELFSLKAATRQDLLKARSELELARAKLKEAQQEVDIAKRDVEACVIKAPFTGYVGQRHKQPNEPVERNGKIASLVDSTRVYAVANIEEQAAPAFEKGARAVFVHRSGKTFEGKIDRVGPVMDAKARTRKVFCLIANDNASLSAGMTGTLRVVER